MGYEKFKRPLLSGAGLQIEAASTFTASVLFSGNAGLQESVETTTSTGTLRARGLSILKPAGTTADKTFTLPVPPAAGVHKFIIANSTGARVMNVTVGGSTAAGFFHGTTSRTIAFSSQSTKERSAHLIGLSTAVWAVIRRSSGTSLAG